MLTQIIKSIAISKGVNPLLIYDSRVKPNIAVRKPDGYKSINSSSVKIITPEKYNR